jgi:hypothetical protein
MEDDLFYTTGSELRSDIGINSRYPSVVRFYSEYALKYNDYHFGRG